MSFNYENNSDWGRQFSGLATAFVLASPTFALFLLLFVKIIK